MTTDPIRHVEARSHQPTGGPLWLGPAIGLFVGLCGLIGFGLYLGLHPIDQGSIAQPTALVITITPSPIVPTATIRPTLPPTAAPHGLYIGGVAIVTGTGSALRLRSDPGLQSTTLKTVADGVRLTILEGPREADNLIWWRLHDPADGAEGWAAQDYLSPSAIP
jgi:SH3 domain-containing protein